MQGNIKDERVLFNKLNRYLVVRTRIQKAIIATFDYYDFVFDDRVQQKLDSLKL
ncbi:hypothetical protein NBE98_02505 [Clostridium swellfunianum]|nr:hypothetical protein [Clostridium swellfunianum]